MDRSYVSMCGVVVVYRTRKSATPDHGPRGRVDGALMTLGYGPARRGPPASDGVLRGVGLSALAHAHLRDRLHLDPAGDFGDTWT